MIFIKNMFNDKSNWFRLGLMVLSLSLLLALWVYLHQPTTWPIKQIKVRGVYPHVNQSQLEKLVKPYVSTGFFAIQPDKIKKIVQTIPWVKSVDIKRVWPHTIILKINEKKPIGVFNKTSLITETGVVFTPIDKKTIPRQLPHFNGPDYQAKLIIKKYNLFNDFLKKINLKVIKLDLTARQAWDLTLSNNLKIYLGRLEVKERLERFISIYNKTFAGRAQDIAYIDCRYPNGMAVEYRKA